MPPRSTAGRDPDVPLDQPWTPADDIRVRALADTGLTVEQAAASMGRHRVQVRTHAARLGVQWGGTHTPRAVAERRRRLATARVQRAEDLMTVLEDLAPRMVLPHTLVELGRDADGASQWMERDQARPDSRAMAAYAQSAANLTKSVDYLSRQDVIADQVDGESLAERIAALADDEAHWSQPPSSQAQA